MGDAVNSFTFTVACGLSTAFDPVNLFITPLVILSHDVLRKRTNHKRFLSVFLKVVNFQFNKLK